MRSYNAILLLMVTLVLLACGATVWWAQPLSGDLARVGAWPERWFGWQEPQQKISAVKSPDDGTHKPHILVVGDSFSDAGFWQAYLAERYRFTFVHINTIDMATLPARIRQAQADAVVIEAVERTFDDVFGDGGSFQTASAAASCGAAVVPDQVGDIVLADRIALLPTFPLNRRRTMPESPVRLAEGFHYLKTWGKLLLKPKKRKALALPLDRGDLFSSRISDRMLVLPGDALLKKPLPSSQVQSIQCALQRVARGLQQTGLPFAIVAIPDKSSVYQPFLAEATLRQQPLLINRVAPERVLHAINLLPLLQQMVERGVRDVYLPDDSHWGYRGFQLAAVMIDQELAKQRKPE